MTANRERILASTRWVQQQARNVLMWLEEQNLSIRFLIHDRDTKFSYAFRRLFISAGIQSVRTPLLVSGLKS